MSVITILKDRKFSIDGINTITVVEGQVLEATPAMLKMLSGDFKKGSEKEVKAPLTPPEI